MPIEEKFYFHMNNFDNEVMDEGLLEEETEEELPPPPPLFTEDQLNANKKQAFEEGFTKGKTEEKSSQNTVLATAISQLSADLQTLFQAEQAREESFEREVISLCEHIFSHVFPVLCEQQGMKQIKTILENVLNSQLNQKEIEISVAASHKEAIKGALSDIQSSHSDVRFMIRSDEQLSEGSFKLKWSNGGALYDANAIAQAISENLKEMLAEDAAKSHDGMVQKRVDTQDKSDKDVPNDPIMEDNHE